MLGNELFRCCNRATHLMMIRLDFLQGLSRTGATTIPAANRRSCDDHFQAMSDEYIEVGALPSFANGMCEWGTDGH